MFVKQRLSSFYGLNSERVCTVPLRHQDILIAIGLGSLVILLGWWQMIVGVCGVYHDDAIYVITAKALAQGEGYRLINLPNCPLQTKYPILYPALLSIIWKIWPSFPQNLLAMQGLSLMAGASTVAFSYLYLVRFGYASRRVALVSGLFCATSALFLYFSTLTLSETPYALVSILVLWAIDREARLPHAKPSAQIVLGLLLALPFLTRVIGIVLVPAGLMTLYLSGRRIGWVSLGVAFTVLPWVIWILVGPKWTQDQVNTYYTNYGSWWFSFGLLNLFRLVMYNSLYIIASLPTISFAFFDTMLQRYGLVVMPIIIFLSLITLIGIVKNIMFNRILCYYLIGYLCVIMLWPWPPSRFIIPVLPLLLAFMFGEIVKMSSKISILSIQKYLYLLFVGIIGFLLVFNVNYVNNTVKTSHAMGYPYPSVLKEPISWSSYEGIFTWINNHAQGDDILASGLDTMLYLYTDRRSFRPFTMNPMALFYSSGSRPMTMEKLIGILTRYQPKYLIQTPMPLFGEEKPFAELLCETIIKYPGWLKVVYVGEDKRFLIYELQANLEPPGNY
jgi:hypothetical protein